jgi:hypothetical protein
MQHTMSQRYLKARTASKRLTPQTIRRPATQREVWQRIQKRGRASFLLRTTLIFGCILLSLALLVELFLHHRAEPVELAGIASLCLVLGYVAGSLIWNRGLSALKQSSRTALRGR